MLVFIDYYSHLKFTGICVNYPETDTCKFVCGCVVERRAVVPGDGVFVGAREATLHFSAS